MSDTKLSQDTQEAPHQVVLFADPDTIPFPLPAGGWWVPAGFLTRDGKTRPTILTNVGNKTEALAIAELAREEGYHGFIRPRFPRRFSGNA